MKTLEGSVAGAMERPARPDRGGAKSEGLRAGQLAWGRTGSRFRLLLREMSPSDRIAV